MRILLALIAFLPCFAFADFEGVDYGFAQHGRPTYGVNYEYQHSLLYVDTKYMANEDMIQPMLSIGAQTKYVNVGVAGAADLLWHAKAQWNVGPEVGFMYSITSHIYIKENNQWLYDIGTKEGAFNGIVSVGLNL